MARVFVRQTSNSSQARTISADVCTIQFICSELFITRITYGVIFKVGQTVLRVGVLHI